MILCQKLIVLRPLNPINLKKVTRTQAVHLNLKLFIHKCYATLILNQKMYCSKLRHGDFFFL